MSSADWVLRVTLSGKHHERHFYSRCEALAALSEFALAHIGNCGEEAILATIIEQRIPTLPVSSEKLVVSLHAD